MSRPVARPIAQAKLNEARRLAFQTFVGEELRAAREAANISQEAVAEQIGWTRSAWSKVEKGHVQIKLHDYMMAVEFLSEHMHQNPAVDLAKHLFRKIAMVYPRLVTK